MARLLSFDHRGTVFRCALQKVDRGRLYGSRDLETLDPEGGLCQLATIAADGRTLLPPGGTAIGHLDSEGRWLASEALTAVDPAGMPLPRVASSFDAPIPLAETVCEELFLDHSMRLLYALEPAEELEPALTDALDDGAVFTFPFCWRDGFDTDPAFLFRGADGNLWLLVGDPNEVVPVGLEADAATVAFSENEEEPAAGDLDFRML
jgi:hypothetical protein